MSTHGRSKARVGGVRFLKRHAARRRLYTNAVSDWRERSRSISFAANTSSRPRRSPMSHSSTPSDAPIAPRRRFLGGIAAGITALIAGRAATAEAEIARITSTPPADEKWVARIKGTHRQVVDCSTHND